VRKLLLVARAGLGAALALSLFAGPVGCKVSTANLSDVRVCPKVNAEGVCPEDAAEIPADTEIVHASALLQNAPPDTVVTVAWRYLEGPAGQPASPDGAFEIDSAQFVAKDPAMSLHGVLTRPHNGWPKGRYEVVLTVAADNVDPVRKTFAIP